MVRFLTPFVYGAVVPAVCLALIVVVATIERTIGFHTLRRAGDIDAVVSLVLIGSPVFVGMTLLLTRLESLVNPDMWSHFRHCFFLYTCGAVLAIALVIYRENNGGLAYAYVFMLCATSVYAILMNALTLASIRYRQGSAAKQCAAADN